MHNVELKIRALLVDDEKSSVEVLKHMINEYCPSIEIVATARSTKIAREKYKELKPDAIFLDINMPGENGFEFMNFIGMNHSKLVIVSAYIEHALKALKSNVVDFLLKPISPDDLINCEKKLVTKIMEEKNAKEICSAKKVVQTNIPKILVKHFQGFTMINVEDIIRLEADANYTKLFLLNQQPMMSSKNLKEFEDVLDPNSFFRIHKSHIISLKYILEYNNLDGGYVKMVDNSIIMIARRKHAEFLSLLGTYSLSIR